MKTNLSKRNSNHYITKVLLSVFVTVLLIPLAASTARAADLCADAAIRCNDNNACTTDTCDSVTGACGHTAIVCNDSKICTTDSCNTATGCVFTNNTLACNDSNYCTVGDSCANGVCVPGAPKVCNDNNPCTTDSCVPILPTGCVFNPNILPCDDGNACTVNDMCKNSVCTGTPKNCDDNNSCTIDSCNTATSNCVRTLSSSCPASCAGQLNGTACSDNNACTINDVCTNEVCGGTARICNDNNPCTADTCDPSNGCVFTINNTLPCFDTNSCTDGDYCFNGVCNSGVLRSCDDNNPCTDDKYIPVIAQCCVRAPNTKTCNDNNACTTSDVCKNSVCAGTAKNCNDYNACTTDTCEPATGNCIQTQAPTCYSCTGKPDGTACSDNNACTVDVCTNQVCVSTTPQVCNDNNPCTTDTCNTATGCVFTNNTLSCNDSNYCTVGDTCANGVCVPGPLMSCDDGNVCTSDVMAPFLPVCCTHGVNTLPCNDGNACTIGDVCANRACVPGTSKNCDDGNLCTTDTCNTATGCVHTAVADGTACNDGNACTENDACSGGVCVAGAPKVCPVGVCDPASGCPITYTITASAGANGAISPSGVVSVVSGATATFTVMPNTGYHVSDVLVDMASAGTVTSYTFNNVSADHTISALFSVNSTTTTVNGGVISSDTTWTIAGSPYIVMGTVSVYGTPTTPVTLTIDPGVVVKFSSGAGLQIGSSTNQGALVARGTANNRITFTRSGTSGTWAGITFNDGTVDNVTILENADVQYTTGIVMNSASPKIINSSVTNVTGWGMYLTSSNPVLDNVIISNSGGVWGIYLSQSSPIITGGSLTNATPAGSGISGSGSPVISNYTISVVNAVGNYGVYLSSSTSTLSITNSTIGNGLFLSQTGITPTITGNTFTNYDNSPLRAGAMIVNNILDNNTFTGMTPASRIEVLGDQVTQDTRWKKWMVPYVVISGTIWVYKDTVTPATLTIDPGVLVKFTPGYIQTGAIQIGYNTNLGALVARGTAAEHITFTRNGTSGNWSTITFNNGTVDSTTALEYIDIQYSGGIKMNSASPTIKNSTLMDVSNMAMDLYSSNPIIENVTITNNAYGIRLNWSSSPIITGGSLTSSYSTGGGIFGSGSPVISNYSISIVNSAGAYGVNLYSTTSSLSITNSNIANGLYIGPTGIMPTITGNTFTNADTSPLHAGANIVAQILDNNTFSGMTSAGRIEVAGEVINRDTRWKQAAPYVISGWVSVYKDNTTASTLTIDPGVTVKFTQGGMQIGYYTMKGVLIAKGTVGSKILFTSSQTTPTAGYWGGITFSGDAASSSTLEQVIVEYAGSGGVYSSANIILNSSSPVIRNSIIRNSSQSGIYANSAQSWPVTIDSEITGNKWGIYSSSSNPYITNTKITGNTTAGVWNASTTMDVDARDNWWGVATGPTYTSNPKGTGDKISDRVLYNPWLGQAPGSTLSITGAKVLPPSMNPEGDYVTFTATISSPATWTITISDANNATVKTFSGMGTTINQKWYGENSQSTKVSDGVYYYKIDAMDTGGNTASSPQGLIMVSRQLPIAIMDPPYDNQMFQCGSPINITGTAADSTDFKNYSIDYGAGENPTSWTNLKTSTTSTTNGLLYAWNTSSLTGYSYTVRLTVNDNAGNIATETSRVRFLCIQNAAVSEGYISPNADGVKDATSISATFVHSSNWTVTIKNSSAIVVRTFSDVATSVTQTWDGKDSSGVVVPDGTYTYQIDAVGAGTSIAAAPKTGSIVVDTVSPVAQITAPAANAVLRDTIQIIGTATDLNLGNYQLEYGPNSGVGPWSLISSATTSISSGTLSTWVTNDATTSVLVPNGSYLLRLVVTDKAGNSTISTAPVSVNNLILSSISAISHTLNTYLNETSTISYAINSAATVTLKIVPEKQGPTGTPVYQASQAIAAAGAYFFTWVGKDNTGKVVPDEAYLYVLAASDGTRTDAYSPAAPTGTGTVTCSQSTGFDFAKNLPMTITFTPIQPSRVNINISWGSQNFKIQDAVAATSGGHTYVWDGRNPSNKLLDVGAQSSCSMASLLRENYIITTGDTISAPELKTDPYSMQLAYSHFTRIKYTLPRDANVTLKLTSPTGAVILLFNNQFQTAGPQEIDWNGMDATDTTGKKALVTEEGDYMVSVQTVNPVTGTSSTARGNLRIGY